MFECKACKAKDAELARAIERERILIEQIMGLQQALDPKIRRPLALTPKEKDAAPRRAWREPSIPAFAGSLVADGHLRSLDEVRAIGRFGPEGEAS